MKITPRDYQAEGIEKGVNFFEDKKPRKPSIYVAPTACHAIGEKVLTYSGELVKIECLKVGQELMGDDSTPRVIQEIHTGIDDLYEITLRNGITIKVNGSHILYLERTGAIYKKKYQDETYPVNTEVTVKKYLKWAKSRKYLYKLKRTGVTWADSAFESKLPSTISPYFLGLWLGDGFSSAPVITTIDKEIIQYLKEYCKTNGFKYSILHKNGTKAINFSIHSKGTNNKTLKKIMREASLIENKHIPSHYLLLGVQQRKELLAGLIDSDGYKARGSRNYEITLKGEDLINQVYFLANSVGYIATKKESYKSCTNCKDTRKRKYFKVSFRSCNNFPTIVKRKKPIAKIYKKRNDLFSFTVNHIGKGEYVGFSLDKNKLYLDGHFIIHHNSGKSILIGGITRQLKSPTLVLQPSKELLEQNYGRLIDFGGEASIFSASMGVKEIGHVTYATLGSIKSKALDFKFHGVRNVIIDECNTGYSPEKGSMFTKFMNTLKPKKVLGFTATPVRLKSYGNFHDNWSQLNFLNTGRPTFFKDVLDVIPISMMVERGFWSKLHYELYDFDESTLLYNSTGADFSEETIKRAVADQGINNNIYLRLHSLLKEGKKGILVFCDSVANAQKLASLFSEAECVWGGMPIKDRTKIVNAFKSGELRIITNYSALGIGFDYPELDTIIIGKPTNSLAFYYQWIGRCTRIHPNKPFSLVIDYCNNVKRFGKVEDLNFQHIEGFGWGLFGGEYLLSNVRLDAPKKTIQELKLEIAGKFKDDVNMKMWFGKYRGVRVKQVPLHYLKFMNEKFDFSSAKMKLLKKQIDEILSKN